MLSLLDSKYSNAFRVVAGNSDESALYKIPAIGLNSLIQEHALEQIDILKIDIEGSELELFSENYEWINKVSVMIVETLDNIKKDTAKTLFKAMSEFNYKLVIEGRNLIFYMQKD